MDMIVKFKPKKIDLEPKDILNLSNLVEGEIVHDPTGRHQPGALFVINYGDISSTKFPDIMFPAPNPVEFYLYSTFESLQKIKSLEKEVKADQKRVNVLILEDIKFCIFGICALESFVNQIIPATYEYDDGKKKVNKNEIERYWKLEDKFKIIITQISGISIAGDAKKWSTITDLIALRNDLIHLKTTYPEVSDFRSYQDLYKRLLDLNYGETYEVIKDTLSLIATQQSK